jgi:hypothetical protein
MKKITEIPVITLLTAIPILAILFVALAAVPVSAGDISISAEISNASIAFEDRDTLTVKLVWEGEPFLYVIDDFPMPGLEKMQILGSASSVSTEIDSTVQSWEVTTRTFAYYLEPTDFGTGVVLPLNISAKNRVTEEVHDLQTGQLTVEIAKPVPQAKKEESGSGLFWFIILGIIILWAVGIYIHNRKKKAGVSVQPVDRTYIEALEEIKKETVADRKLFYSRLYRLLLQFLEKERGLDVSGKTGEEVIEVANSIGNEGERLKIIGWLNQMQKEKYRPDQPSAGDVENSFVAFRSFFEDKMQDK